MTVVLSALGGGLVFGAGLVISGMADTRRVLGFLDLFGTWDPTLLIVMAAALAVAVPAFALAQRRGRPVLVTGEINWPARKAIDAPLILGATLFGIGWGLIGLCPGPALVNLATLSPQIFAFVAAMLVGMIVQDVRRGRPSPQG